MEGERVTESHEQMLTKLLMAVGEQTIHIQNLTSQIARLNNRTGKLEDWKAATQIMNAHDSGVVEGRVGLKKAQLGVIIGIVSASGSIVGVIVNKAVGQ